MFVQATSCCTESLKGAVQGDRDPTDALVAKYNQAEWDTLLLKMLHNMCYRRVCYFALCISLVS